MYQKKTFKQLMQDEYIKNLDHDVFGPFDKLLSMISILDVLEKNDKYSARIMLIYFISTILSGIIGCLVLGVIGISGFLMPTVLIFAIIICWLILVFIFMIIDCVIGLFKQAFPKE